MSTASTFEPYIHTVHYYETDKMGITHHSNYIRWMEEARVDFLEKIGCGYDKMEAMGIVSPVVALECSYKTPTKFNDKVMIHVSIKEFRGVRLVISYKMIHQESGKVVLTGESQHCFLNEAGRPIILAKSNPEIDALIKTYVAAAKE